MKTKPPVTLNPSGTASAQGGHQTGDFPSRDARSATDQQAPQQWGTRKPIPAAPAGSATDHHYDFSDCPPDQVLFCCIHEFFRSSPAATARLTKFGRDIRSRLKGVPRGSTLLPPDIRVVAETWPAGYFMIACGLDRLLGAPYLDIEPASRVARLRHYCAPIPLGITEGKEPFAEIAAARGAVQVVSEFEILKRIRAKREERRLFLMIDPYKYSPTAIGLGCKLEVLDWSRTLDEKVRPTFKGRQSPADLLIALQAYRLRQKYGHERALEMTGYTEEKTLSNACNRAIAAIHQLETSGWLSDDFHPPMCFPMPRPGFLKAAS
jgi:hypothetical protein